MKSKPHSPLMVAALLFASCVSAPKESVNSLPQAIVQKTPAYPVDLIKRDIIEDAVVEVEFTVAASGDVVEPRVMTNSRPEYARVAIPCVLAWKFKPRIQNGIPVDTRMRVPLYFTAHEEK